jgi:hypothetical protein
MVQLIYVVSDITQNRVLRRIFGPKRDEVTEGLRKLHNENNLYTSQSIIKMVKSMRMRWAGHVAHMCMSLAGKSERDN